MASELNIIATQEGGATRFCLEGKIDESSDYSVITSSDSEHIILDFEKVTLINSSGIQKWISFLRSIGPSVKVDFDNCPLRIINQMNLIPAFVADRSIVPVNFYAPYYCESCDESMNIKVKTGEVFPDLGNVQVPGMKCPECGDEMEFDGIEKKYFMFLKRAA